jgi:hypothetical protein
LCSGDIHLERPTQIDAHLLCWDGFQVGESHRKRCSPVRIEWCSVRKRTQ